MRRHEAWRVAYRLDRYLRSATIASIEQRSRDIALNMMNVNAGGQLTPGIPEESLHWWELWTHILEEVAIRSIDYRTLDLMDPDAMPWLSAPDAPRGLRILGRRQLPKGDFLARVGQREHLIASFESGRFRIAPATSYTDPSLNPAIRDEELSVTAVRSGDTAVIRPYDPVMKQSGDPIAAIGDISYSRSTPDNFFVLCMSNGYRPRILDDFSADALLIIHNVNRFLIRLEKAVKKVRPDLRMYARPIIYYDPYRVRPDTLEPEFAKHFRYAYQREYRAVWHKQGLQFSEEPFFVELGTMQDISSLFVLRA